MDIPILSVDVYKRQALESFRPRCTAALSLMAASLLCLLFLLWSAGHKEGKEEIILSWQDKIFLEFHWFFLLTVGTALAAGGLYLAVYKRQVQGAHDMYRVGEYMIYTDGKTYQCKQDTNFSPEDYAQAWEVCDG